MKEILLSIKLFLMNARICSADKYEALEISVLKLSRILSNMFKVLNYHSSRKYNKTYHQDELLDQVVRNPLNLYKALDEQQLPGFFRDNIQDLIIN